MFRIDLVKSSCDAYRYMPGKYFILKIVFNFENNVVYQLYTMGTAMSHSNCE